MFKAQQAEYAAKLETLEAWELRELQALFLVTRPGSDELRLVEEELTERESDEY
jgi:hypothetical protein